MSRLPAVWMVVALAVVPAVVVAQPPGPQGGFPGRLGRQGQMPPRGGRAVVDEPKGTSVIRGTIVAADSGSPLRRAQVRVSGQGVPARLATTDAQGRFEIKELPAGSYNISAQKAGFVSLQY